MGGPAKKPCIWASYQQENVKGLGWTPVQWCTLEVGGNGGSRWTSASGSTWTSESCTHAYNRAAPALYPCPAHGFNQWGFLVFGSSIYHWNWTEMFVQPRNPGWRHWEGRKARGESSGSRTCSGLRGFWSEAAGPTFGPMRVVFPTRAQRWLVRSGCSPAHIGTEPSPQALNY